MERPRPDIDSVREAMREHDQREAEDEREDAEDAEDQPTEGEDEDED
jgi:hypothetical protein